MTARPAALAVWLMALAGCGASVRAPDAGPPAAAKAAVAVNDPPPPGAICRIGPDGGAPKVADRGIGGTGSPMIGVLTATLDVADRGIGGTGIVGTVTGFASICVDGLEVAYNSATPVDVDGIADAPGILRAGQVVVIRAGGTPAAPEASRISVRSEAAGRIETIELGTGILTIAGQPVLVPPGTRGSNRFGPGDWVRVSGMRRQDGTIVASRFDPVRPGTLLARGPVERTGDILRVGRLVLHGSAAADATPGRFVTVSGAYKDSTGEALSAAPDTLASDPSGYFGASVGRITIQGYVRVDQGAVWLNGAKIKAAAGIAVPSAADRLGVLTLERDAEGAVTAVGLRYTVATTEAAGSPGRAARSARDDSNLAVVLTRHPVTAPAAAAPMPNEPAAITPPSIGIDPEPMALPALQVLRALPPDAAPPAAAVVAPPPSVVPSAPVLESLPPEHASEPSPLISDAGRPPRGNPSQPVAAAAAALRFHGPIAAAAAAVRSGPSIGRITGIVTKNAPPPAKPPMVTGPAAKTPAPAVKAAAPAVKPAVTGKGG